MIYAKECYHIACEYGVNRYIYSTLTIYCRTAKYRECEDVSLQAWEMDSTNLTEARYLAHNISLSNIHLGNEEKAAVFLTKYGELSNEYTAESYHKKTVEMEAKYESEKKEMRIVALGKEQNLYTGIGVAIAVALFSVIGLL